MDCVNKRTVPSSESLRINHAHTRRIVQHTTYCQR